ncbi:MAG: hypothetical protein KAH17_00215 [Bacteroidales bacterium]|nr:hypothetical protein [Bacteroidales bacterium]
MKKSYLHKLLSILLILLIVIGLGIRLIFPPYFNIGKLIPEASITESALFDSFITNPIDAQSRFAQQVILLEGRITGLDDDMILLGRGMEVVRIKLIKNWRYPVPEHNYDDKIQVKGICRGLDMTEVLVTHAFIVTVRE